MSSRWTAALLVAAALAVLVVGGAGAISAASAVSLLVVALLVGGLGYAGTARARNVARIGIGVAALPALLLLAIFFLIELGETVLLRTFDDRGEAEETRLWVVDYDGSPWLGAGGGETRRWYQRLLAAPRVEVVRDGRAHCFEAAPDFDHAARDAVVDLTREKYRLGNAGLSLGNTLGIPMRAESVAIPVRLTPCEPGTL